MYDADKEKLSIFVGGVIAMMLGAAIVYFVVTRYYPERLSAQVPSQSEGAPTRGPVDVSARP